MIKSGANILYTQKAHKCERMHFFITDINEAHIYQLVMILGGIDDILSHYLSPENNINLSQMQISQIKQIICSSNNNVSETGSSIIQYYNLKGQHLPS